MYYAVVNVQVIVHCTPTGHSPLPKPSILVRMWYWLGGAWTRPSLLVHWSTR